MKSHRHEHNKYFRGPSGHGSRGRRRRRDELGAGGERGRGRRGRGRGVLDAAELRLLIMKFLAEETRHGYDVIRAIEDQSGGQYAPSPGIVYPALSMLEDQGFIRLVESEGARKAFEITPDGQAELAESAETIDSLSQRLSKLADDENRLNTAPIRRAMDNLKTALRSRMDHPEIDEATVHEIAALLDGTTQQIERL